LTTKIHKHGVSGFAANEGHFSRPGDAADTGGLLRAPASAELLLGRMLAKIERLCDERKRLKKEQGGSMKGRVLCGRSW
jgi:hypothetical protein